MEEDDMIKVRTKTCLYDAILVDGGFFNNRCNLNCKYCFLFGNHNKGGVNSAIDIDSFIKTLEKTGKIFKIIFCGGGEPFLISNILEACKKLTKKHYIGFNTNLTSNKIKEFAEKINPKKVGYIHASCHIKELERLNLLDRYIENFLLLKKKGFEIYSEAVAYPHLAKEVKKYKKIFRGKGINLSFSEFKGKYDGKEYPKSYTKKEKKIFRFNHDPNKLHNQYNTVCNAGYNIGVISSNGNIKICDTYSQEIGNIYKEIKFKKELIICKAKFCDCPMKEYEKALFNKALKENSISPRNIMNEKEVRLNGRIEEYKDKIKEMQSTMQEKRKKIKSYEKQLKEIKSTRGWKFLTIVHRIKKGLGVVR